MVLQVMNEFKDNQTENDNEKNTCTYIILSLAFLKVSV